ncbi:SPOR domain-containing protein [Croceicoccus marinus]|uniref:Tetratricopeptide repeat protein n=1 Tax=Croceicoccus marinus TaxID=450378 RepID=A0A7G6VTJ2_9SPHN|nr:SPOR domain-containing protein [Croceicoccus marinus]QNE05057.1 tetratricopeptide repeat protein [Croceicoccus marinus]
MKTRIRRKALLIALAGATAAALPVAAPARDNAQKAEAALARENADKAVSYAERAVIENPRDPETRVLLGQAYLKAGRLVSARDSLAAAVELGDASPRTALMLALAQVGAGEPRLAIGTINMQGSAIPSADRGLALALAGETARGVEVISADIRAGNNTPKSRQNLAYAYALDGRWREARAMAAQDVPADQIGDRMTEWASTARPDLYAQRVAALVGAEAVEDRGMPQQLALANSAPIPVQPPAPRMAAAPEHEPASKPAPAAVAEAQLDDAELPPVRQQARPAAPANSSTVSLAVVQPAPAAPSSRGKPKPVVVASLPPSSAAAPAPAAKPAAEPVRVAAAPAPAPKPAAKPAAKPAVKSASKPAAKPQLPVPAARGTHVAQLGSYASPDAAQAGWKVFQSRYANLKGAQPVITKATVDGKDYWRVAAGGFDRQGANAMCSAVKASGNGCIPIAQSNGTSGPNKARLATVD